MIHIEITQSPDSNVIATFQFHKNEIYLGREGSDLSIDDMGLKDSHLLIEIPEDALLVHPQRDIAFYHLNGKRSTSIRKLKAGDTLGIGGTIIKIIGFERTLEVSKKDLLSQKLSHLMEINSPRIPVIEKITKMMK